MAGIREELVVAVLHVLLGAASRKQRARSQPISRWFWEPGAAGGALISSEVGASPARCRRRQQGETPTPGPPPRSAFSPFSRFQLDARRRSGFRPSRPLALRRLSPARPGTAVCERKRSPTVVPGAFPRNGEDKDVEWSRSGAQEQEGKPDEEKLLLNVPRSIPVSHNALHLSPDSLQKSRTPVLQ